MVDKVTIMRSFNSHFIEMMNDIIGIFPRNSDIKSGLNSFEFFKQLNPSLVIKCWFSSVTVPYSEIINSGDITFFCEKDYSQDLQNITNAGDIMCIIEKIREPIKSMDVINRQHTAKYLQNLCELSKIYHTL